MANQRHLPRELTSFVGREAQVADLKGLLRGNRLLTLTGAGGIGKTRLAVRLATQLAGDSDRSGGVWFIDLAPISDPGLVSLTAARALGLPDQPGRSPDDGMMRFIDDNGVLLVLDNCEHLLEASAALSATLLGACPALTVLATSREPLAMPGELTWRVPSLSLVDEATELFTERARRARPDLTVTADDDAAVADICRLLDGMPLALELAAARVRALSLTEIRDGLDDRFRLLTGGARTVAPRQQTLRASVDWSHDLLTEPERRIFRRLAVFTGGFDLAAAQSVCSDHEFDSRDVIDLMARLVDRSLVTAEHSDRTTRYRLMETIRQYAMEKLGEAREIDELDHSHRDHYVRLATAMEEVADRDFDNVRAAFVWSVGHDDIAEALRLTSALQPLWLSGGRIVEGLTWFHAVAVGECADDLDPAVRGRALADVALLNSVLSIPDTARCAERSLAIARNVGESGLLLRALIACGSAGVFDADAANLHLDEALGLARATEDQRNLSHALWWKSYAAAMAGDPRPALEAGAEGLRIARERGDHFVARMCRFWGPGTARMLSGEFVLAAIEFRELLTEAEVGGDPFGQLAALSHLAYTLIGIGDVEAGQAAPISAARLGSEFGGFAEAIGYAPLALAALFAGDMETAVSAGTTARQQMSAHPVPSANGTPMAEIALARGELATARKYADEAVSLTNGVYRAMALTARSRVALAEDDVEAAEQDAHAALSTASSVDAHTATPDALECLAAATVAAGGANGLVRLLGAADALRKRMGARRNPVYQSGHDSLVAAVRDLVSADDFAAAWDEGAALSTQDAIAYARRGRGERKRPASGWASLTPTERDVVRLVGDGLANKDIATRLFMSPRTVASHLTHVYAKLAVTSRVQLAQEATRRAR
ncbi:MAG: hypothetical protein QOC69_5465 [Mycobacterium sp.]|nr:hypothetical protein [Mycobacterium sp.]